MLDIKSSLQKSINSINTEVDRLITTIKNQLIERDSELKAEGIGCIYYNMEWHNTAYLWISDSRNMSICTWEFQNEDLAKYIDGLSDYVNNEISNYLWLARSDKNDWKIVLWENK